MIILDPLDEHQGILFFTLDDFAFYMSEHFKDDEFRLVCRFQDMADYEAVFEIAETIKNVCLVVEEAQIYISARSRESKFLRLCHFGRHWDVKVIGIARRTPELSSDFRALSQHIISFCQTHPPDVKTMADMGVYDVDKLEGHDYKEVIY